MKFIVDAQLPKSLSDFLNQKGFDSIHTLDLPDKNKTKDRQIAKLANEEDSAYSLWRTSGNSRFTAFSKVHTTGKSF